MKSLRCLTTLLSILFAFTLVGQRVPDLVTGEESPESIAARAVVAERIVAAREGPGRTLDESFRRQMLQKLIALPMEKLQDMEAEGAITSQAIGDSAADLVYHTLAAPCRIIDTRPPSGGGPLVVGNPQNFIVAGLCGIPFGPATVVVINFVAVSPSGAGNLRGSAYPNPVPATGSFINYQLLTPSLNIANGLPFPICNPAVSLCFSDITVQANGANTHLVADVLGWFQRFPKEQAVSEVVSLNIADTTVGDVPTAIGQVTINAPVAGKVMVILTGHAVIFGNNTVVDVGIGTTLGGKELGIARSGFLDGSGTERRSEDMATHVVVSVGVGSHTYYATAEREGPTFGAQTVNLGNFKITALFIPD